MTTGIAIETITFVYAGDDQIVSADDARPAAPITDVLYNYTYNDPLRRRVTTTQTLSNGVGVTQTNTYESNGDRDFFSISGGGIATYYITYAYDGLGRETQVTQYDTSFSGGAASESATFKYNAAGEFVRITRSDGITPALDKSTYAYDNAGRLVTLAHTVGTTNTNRGTYTYSYDAAGRIVQKPYQAAAQTQAQAEVNTFG